MSLTGNCFRHLAGWFVAILLAGCHVAPPAGVTPVAPFDAKRYLGTWYEIARLDHRFERGLTRVAATYSEDGEGIRVLNRGYDTEAGRWREAVGRARFIAARDVGSLKVSFFGPFYGGYHVVALDADYQWALVMGPNRDYFWILARSPKVDEARYQQLLARAAALGIDTAALVRVPH